MTTNTKSVEDWAKSFSVQSCIPTKVITVELQGIPLVTVAFKPLEPIEGFPAAVSVCNVNGKYFSPFDKAGNLAKTTTAYNSIDALMEDYLPKPFISIPVVR